MAGLVISEGRNMANEVYARVLTTLPWDEKIGKVPKSDTMAALGLYTAALCFCQENRTDGRIPFYQTPKLIPAGESDLYRVCDMLVGVGLFDVDEGAHLIHNYLLFNKSRAEIEREIGQKKTAGRLGGNRSAQARAQAPAQAGAQAESNPALISQNSKDLKDSVGESPDPNKETIAEIIDYLNLKADTAFKPTTAGTVRHINARLKEGYELADFKSVIDKKVAAWLPDPRMRIYLRPDTLFCGKFEGYVNEKSDVDDDDPLAGKWLA